GQVDGVAVLQPARLADPGTAVGDDLQPPALRGQAGLDQRIAFQGVGRGVAAGGAAAGGGERTGRLLRGGGGGLLRGGGRRGPAGGLIEQCPAACRCDAGGQEKATREERHGGDCSCASRRVGDSLGYTSPSTLPAARGASIKRRRMPPRWSLL